LALGAGAEVVVAAGSTVLGGTVLEVADMVALEADMVALEADMVALEADMVLTSFPPRDSSWNS
jgi:hypothetical protein